MERKMSIVANRLKTFENDWSHESISDKEMAQHGFYIKENKKVMCFFCEKTFERSDISKDIFEMHAKYPSDCYLTNDMSKEVYDKLKIYEPKSDLNKIIPPEPSSPKFPIYELIGMRINSYIDWPTSLKQKPEILAEAGFFYTGRGDKVVCFMCGGGLHQWDEDDDVWEEHIKWYSHCDHIHRQKTIGEIIQALEKRFSVNLTMGAAKALITKSSEPPIKPKRRIDPENVTRNLENKAKRKLFKEFDEVEEGKCKVCVKNERDIMFLPCNHLAACFECASVISFCPIYFKKYSATKLLFFDE